MYGRLFADQGSVPCYVVIDNVPGSGLIYFDEIGRPRYGVVQGDDIGDILDE